MKNLVHCYIGALVFVVVLYGVQARVRKGGYTCGQLFNGTTGSIINNTLHPSTICEYHIESENHTINILLQMLFLDAMDNVTITKFNETEPLFPVFHGQEESVPLITHEKKVTITIAVSSVGSITRHFELFYDGKTPDCAFVIHDELKVQQPLTANRTGNDTECAFTYNSKPHITLSFSFLNFNLGKGSQINISGVEEGPIIAKGQERQPDLFATAQAKFEVSLKLPNDTFVLQQHQLNADCSGYKKINGSEKINSPPLPKLDNGSLITECRWLFKNKNHSLGFTLNTIDLNGVYDMLVITDGENFDSPPLRQITSITEKEALDNIVITRTANMIVSFKPSSLSSNFSATVYNADHGHSLLKNGTLTMSGPSKTNSTWLLQVGNNENVILNFTNSSFKAPATLDVYDDFSFKSNHIASLHGNISSPVLSKTSRMMLVASSFGDKDTFKAEFHGSVKTGKGGYTCGHLFNGTTGSIANNTLRPNTICEYHIESENDTINILLQTLFLDAMDNVTITKFNESEPLFPVFHGQEESVPLITHEKRVTITIAVSSVRSITRHFELFYDGKTPVCAFVIHDELKVQQPLTANRTGNDTECAFTYNSKPHIALSFSFLNFNLGEGSQIAISGVEEGPITAKGQERQPDLFAVAQAKFEVSLKSPNDTFVLQQHQLNADCSGYKEITGSEKIISPPLPKLDNGSLITECRWLFKNKNLNSLGFTLNTIDLNSVYDMLVITDGQNFDSPPLHEITSITEKEALGNVVITSTANMIVSFKPSSLSSNFSATVYNAEHGHSLLNNGTLTMSGPSKTNNTWLLQVGNNENVILNFKDSSFKAPATLDIYDDFSYKSNHIASLQGNLWYPLLSRTTRMMLVASSFGDKDTFKAEFDGSVAGCVHMSQGSGDSYVLSGNCNSSCLWIIPPTNDELSDLFVNLQYISLDSDDLIEVFRLDANRTRITNVTSTTTYVPQMSLSATEGALVRVTRGICAQKPNAIVLVAQSHYLPKCSGEITMTPYKSVQLTSPNFPNTYPVFASCNWTLESSPSKQLIHIAFDKLQLAPNHCIVIAGNGTAPTTLMNNSLPDDFFFKTDVLIQFSSNACDPKKGNSMVSNEGFLLNATSTDCGDILTAGSGQFNTTANKSLCIWKISIPPTTKDSVNIIIFSVKPKDKTGNYKLDIYDGATIRTSVIANTSESELWSRTNTLIIVYKPLNISAAASEVTITYKTQSCNQSMLCENKICLHPDWRCNGANDCGDFTDERDCQSYPIPPTPKPSGISPVVFGVVIVLMFCAGVILAIFVPKIKNFRSQYRQFRDVSVID